jgi:NADH dehydrogenase (ubiquinone) 1 beta subcomplex subunit 9
MTTPINAQSRAVCRLYRGALKMSLDWLIDRGKWRAFALALRQEFESQKSLLDPVRQAEYLLAGRHLLYKYRHPEPYICIL